MMRTVRAKKEWLPGLLFFLIVIRFSLTAGASMSDKDFFNALDLEYPGLDSVKIYLSSGDTTKAKVALLTYYKTRTSVQYFKLKGEGNISRADDNLNHYFTVVNIRKYAGDNDGTIDWTTSVPGNSEWHHQFHRMYWLINLGRVYASTGDEKYAREWVAELIDWINDNPPGYPRTLDTGIRIRNWVESYQYFVSKYKSPSITPDDHIKILKSLIEQSLFLRDNWRSDGNWGASETRGLGSVVVMFPEFKFTPEGSWYWWRDLVISRMDHHLSNDFYPDGVQYETSPAYHSLEYRNLFLTYKLMDMNGIELSGALKKKFVKPLEFMMHIHKPDGFLPQLSDTDRKSYLDRLEEGARLFARQDLIYAATRGREGTPPQETFAAFPYGGYFVMRSDWGENQPDYSDTRYLVFDTGSNKPWHAHYDILNFVAYAFGKTIIKDPGRYAYTNRRLEYYKKTIAHNTIVVDGSDQKENAQGVPVFWESLPGYDYVDAYHDAYSSVRHRRKIFFAKPDYWIISDLITGSGAHIYDLYFHLEPAYLNNYTLNSADHSVSTPDFAIIPGDQEADVEIVPGWVSYSVGSELESVTIKYSKHGAVPVTFETVIYPYGNGPIPVSVSKLLVLNEKGWELEDDEAVALNIEFPGQIDCACINHSGVDSLQFGNLGFKGNWAFVRETTAGEITNIEVVNGSSLNKGDTILVTTYGDSANISWYGKAVYIKSETIRSARIWAPQADSLIVNGILVPFTQNGNYVTFNVTAITSENSWTNNINRDFSLAQNFPNPFNRSTTIRFSQKKRNFVSLKIFNLVGEVVTTLINREMDAGQHEVTWKALDMPSGIYFYRLEVGGDTLTKRMLLLK